MSNSSTQIWAMVIVQKNTYGAKPPKAKLQLTASASAARKIVAAQDAGTSQDKVKVEASAKTEPVKTAAEKSTETYYVTGIDPKGAIQFLNRFDSSTKEAKYLEKAAVYQEKKAEYGKTHEIKTLDGPGKVAYSAAMAKYAFTYYKVQVILNFGTVDGLVTDKVASKVHCQTSKPTEAEFLQRFITNGSVNAARCEASPKAEKKPES